MTITARGTTFMWVVIMVLAHVAAVVKSLHTGEARQVRAGRHGIGCGACAQGSAHA